MTNDQVSIINVSKKFIKKIKISSKLTFKHLCQMFLKAFYVLAILKSLLNSLFENAYVRNFMRINIEHQLQVAIYHSGGKVLRLCKTALVQTSSVTNLKKSIVQQKKNLLNVNFSC